MRNALGHFGKLFESENGLINWEHIVNLYLQQRKEGFRLANKLTKQHIEFQKNPMKVKFAVQLLSRSVTNSLRTLRDLNVPEFWDIDATADYLICFDRIFNIMNSRSPRQSLLKAPLMKTNEESWKSVFEETFDYVCNLKTENGKSVLNSSRYASFLGMNTIRCLLFFKHCES